MYRINDYLTSNSLLNPHQSDFTKRRSTETLLTSLYNKLVSTMKKSLVCASSIFLQSLTLSTTTLILKRLFAWFGFTDTRHPPPATFLLVRRLWHSSTLVPVLPATHLNPSHSPVVSLKAPFWRSEEHT